MFTHPPNIFVQPWSERYHHMVYAPIVWGDRFFYFPIFMVAVLPLLSVALAI